MNDYFFNLINKAYFVFIGLISTSLVTRYLGVELKGEYAFIMQIINITVLILNFGIYQSYTYNYRRAVKDIKIKYVNIFSFLFLIYLILSVIFVIVIGNFYFSYLVFLVIPFHIFKLQMENLLLVENIKVKMKTNMLTVTISLFFYVLLFLYAKRGIYLLLLLIILVDIISIIIYLYKIYVTPNPFNLDMIFFKKVIVFGLFPMLSELLIFLNYGVDILMLKKNGNLLELGLYATAAGIINYIWLIPDIFKDVLFSRVAKNNVVKSISLSTKISVGSMFIILIGFLFIGKSIIIILFGHDFINAYMIVNILFLGAFSIVFYKIFGVVLLADGKKMFYFYTLLISALINIGLNFYFIPVFGMYGAAWTSVVSYSVCGIAFLIYFINNYDLKLTDVLLLNKTDILQIKRLIFHK